MAKRTLISEIIGTVKFDDLIGGIYPPAEISSVKVAPGQGVLKKGTILAIAKGSMVALGSVDGVSANAILAADVDTGTNKAVHATAYRKGCFNIGALVDGNSITIADKIALRDVGIMLLDNPRSERLSNKAVLGELILNKAVL